MTYYFDLETVLPAVSSNGLELSEAFLEISEITRRLATEPPSKNLVELACKFDKALDEYLIAKRHNL